MGIGCWIGSGLMPTSGSEWKSPSNSTVGARPERAQQGDLLLDAPAARMEVLAERLELDVVPADADAEPQAPAAEVVDLGRLLGDERRLALRQADDRPSRARASCVTAAR